MLKGRPRSVLDVGRTLPHGTNPRINWILGPAETAELTPVYGPDGFICVLDGDTPIDHPWRENEIEVIRKYSTNQKLDLSYDSVQAKPSKIGANAALTPPLSPYSWVTRRRREDGFSA